MSAAGVVADSEDQSPAAVLEDVVQPIAFPRCARCGSETLRLLLCQRGVVVFFCSRECRTAHDSRDC